LGGKKRVPQQQNIENILVASNEVGLEVNAKDTVWVVTSRLQNVGQNHNQK